jgi:hypothetical protein
LGENQGELAGLYFFDKPGAGTKTVFRRTTLLYFFIPKKFLSFTEAPVTDETVARLRAHDNNISRYRRLLKTKLSDIERQFLEERLAEERSALESLDQPAPNSADRHGRPA